MERRFGWDCHGLPAEMGAEKELGISGRAAIMNFGMDKFNAHCRESVMKYTSEWEYYVNRQGRWVDFKNDYKTMDVKFMESVMWAFKQLYDKGLVYEAHRVMPYSWAAETPLSNFETRIDNSYRERADKAVFVSFKLREKLEALQAEEARIVAWTTTPWTLPSNLALAANSKIGYFARVVDGKAYMATSAALDKLFGEGENVAVPASALVGKTYEPLFPFFANHPNSFKVLDGDFVTDTDGTGIVHLAPGFGEDDQRVCEANGIELVCPVDSAGKFTDEVPDYKGLQVFDANEPIIKHLKTTGAWLKTEQVIHNYPHCWRTDTPLIYRALPSWYVEVTKFRDRMVELNRQINWIPSHVRDGLFGKWLEGARDWSISRNRFWGAPIPVWRSDNPENKKLYVFGSIKELEEFFGQKVTDLHRPFIDQLTKPDPENPQYTLRRVEDVLDCWFESGSMPYAQVHYPFENKDWFENHFPADFIVEYTAQTRGWFYTLMVLGTTLFDKPPFLNCICHGVVLDEKGQKLSKRLNNYPDPKEIFGAYGADAMRWFMLSSPVMRGGELLMEKSGNDVREVVRLALKPIWNAYNFFCLYANSDGIEAKISTSSQNVMDRYILAKLAGALGEIRDSMDSYDTTLACKAVEGFFEALNNWYIRRSRERFWKSERDQDKQDAYDTLYTALCFMSQAAAPLLPFLTEEIYKGLTGEESVHLAGFPEMDFKPEAGIVSKMERIRDICTAALSVRNARNLRVRLPLASLKVVSEGESYAPEFEDIIKDEVNVKNVEAVSRFADFATLKLQINFPAVGKRIPEKIKEITPAGKKGEWKKLPDGRVEVAGTVLEQGEFSILLEPKDKDSSCPLSSNDALAVLDLKVTEELKSEGVARDVVRLIQQARKDAGLNVSDRIALRLELPSEAETAVTNFKSYIAEQTLCAEIALGKVSQEKYKFEKDMDGIKVTIGFEKAAA